MPDIDRKFITYKSIEEVTREPGEGTWEILTDRWWSFNPSRGLLFYRKSPQCNSSKVIADKITAECHPDATVIFVPRAYLKHNCSDYV
jgi:hypothetical protein